MYLYFNLDANDKEWVENVRLRLGKLLNIPHESITYQRQTKSIRHNVRNLSKTSGTLSSSSSRDDLLSADSDSDQMGRNLSENDMSSLSSGVSKWEGREMPVRRSKAKLDDPASDAFENKTQGRSGNNNGFDRRTGVSNGSRRDTGSPFESPLLSPSTSPALGADADHHNWLLQLRARTPSPPPPGAFEVLSPGESGPTLRAPAPRRLSPEQNVHSLLNTTPKKPTAGVPSGRRSRKSSKTILPTSATGSEATDNQNNSNITPSVDSTTIEPQEEQQKPEILVEAVAKAIPAVVVVDTSNSSKQKQTPNSPRPRSRSAAVMPAGASFQAPSLSSLHGSPTISRASKQEGKTPIKQGTEIPVDAAKKEEEISASSAPTPASDPAPPNDPTPSKFSLPIVEELDLPVPRSKSPPKARQRQTTTHATLPHSSVFPAAESKNSSYSISESPQVKLEQGSSSWVLVALSLLVAAVIAVILAWLLG